MNRLTFLARDLAQHARLIGRHVDIDFFGLELNQRLASLDRLKGTHDQEDPSRSSDASLRINEEQLRSLGMGEPQIKELAKNEGSCP